MRETVAPEKSPRMVIKEDYGALVTFTALAPLAVGGLIGLLFAPGYQVETGIDWAAIVVWVIGLLALAASLFHLGRPWRAPLALRRISTSWLSREILLFGLFLIALGCYAILPVLNPSGQTRTILGLAAAIIGLVGTIATGEIYLLHSRPSWDQWLAVVSFPLGALSAGSLFGFFVARRFSGRSEVASFVWMGVAVLLVSTLVVTWFRSTHHHPGSKEGRLSRQLVLGPYLWLLVVRLAAIAASILLLGIGGEAHFLAWVPALIGEFADRILFFNSVVPVTLRGRYI